MALPEITIRQIKEKFGRNLLDDNDFETLRVSFQEKTGDYSLSLNTMKRLLGVLPSGDHRKYTKHTVARYLDYRDWEEYSVNNLPQDSVSFFGEIEGLLHSSDIEQDNLLTVCYGIGKEVRFTCLGKGLLKVENSVNSSLKTGDIVVFDEFCVGRPLVARSVERNGANLGGYSSRTGNIVSILLNGMSI